MGNFLSPSALRVIAEDIQQGLLDRLNANQRCVYPVHLFWFKGLRNIYTRGTGTRFENQSVAQIVISNATDKS